MAAILGALGALVIIMLAALVAYKRPCKCTPMQLMFLKATTRAKTGLVGNDSAAQQVSDSVGVGMYAAPLQVPMPAGQPTFVQHVPPVQGAASPPTATPSEVQLAQARGAA